MQSQTGGDGEEETDPYKVDFDSLADDVQKSHPTQEDEKAAKSQNSSNGFMSSQKTESDVPNEKYYQIRNRPKLKKDQELQESPED